MKRLLLAVLLFLALIPLAWGEQLYQKTYSITEPATQISIDTHDTLLCHQLDLSTNSVGGTVSIEVDGGNGYKTLADSITLPNDPPVILYGSLVHIRLTTADTTAESVTSVVYTSWANGCK